MAAKFESLYLEVTVGGCLAAVQRLGSPPSIIHADGVYTSLSKRQKAEAVLVYLAAESAALRRCQ